MKHIKLDSEIRKRVKSYHQIIRTKIKDSEILNDVPETIKKDLFLFLFKE